MKDDERRQERNEVIPSLGISICGLKAFIENCETKFGVNCLEGLTTVEVYEKFIETTVLGLSYCTLNAENCKWVGKADVFVIHTWNCIFLDMIECIFNNVNKDSDNALWIDIFSSPQNTENIVRDLEWCIAYQSYIASFDFTLLVGSAWGNHVIFTRTWCLYEIYCARDVQCKFAMTEKGKADFMTSVKNGTVGNEICSIVANLNVLTTLASRHADKNLIIQFIEKYIGADALNVTVRNMVIDWAVGVVNNTIAVDCEANEIEQALPMKIALAQLMTERRSFSDAEDLLTYCIREGNINFGASHENTIGMKKMLAYAMEQQEKYATALSLYEECWTAHLLRLGECHRDTIALMNNVAALYDFLDVQDVAQGMYKECVETSIAILGGNDPCSLSYMKNLAISYANTEKYELAQRLLEKCLSDMESVFGSEDIRTAACMRQLSIVYIKVHRYDLALPLLEACTAANAKKLGNDHSESITSRENLADIFTINGSYEKAICQWKKCYSICVMKYGEKNMFAVEYAMRLADTYMKSMAYDLAHPLLESSLGICHSHLGESHPETLNVMKNLGVCFAHLGEFEKAEKLLKCHDALCCQLFCDIEEEKIVHGKSLSLQKRLHIYEDCLKRVEESKDNMLYCNALLSLAQVHKEMCKFNAAEQLLRECIRCQEKFLGESHLDTISSLGILAHVHHCLQKLDSALELHVRCWEYRSEYLGKQHPDTLKSMNDMGCCLRDKGNYARGQSVLAECLEIRASVLGSNHPDSLQSLSDLAELYEAIGKDNLAEKMFQNCLEKRISVLGNIHPSSRVSMSFLANIHLRNKQYDSAQVILQQLVEACIEAFGTESDSTLKAQRKLEDCKARRSARNSWSFASLFHRFSRINPLLVKKQMK